jgi:hypothetical protein
MSSRSRMMGAGNASSTIYNTNVNENTFGGNKKQGITSRVGLNNWSNLAIQTFSNGYGRDKLICMNQLGGVGAGKSMFNGRFTQTDGVHCNEVVPVPPPPPPPPPIPYTFTTADPPGSGIHIFFNTPYTQITGPINVTLHVNSAANTHFELVTYNTPGFSNPFTVEVRTLLAAGTYSFNLPSTNKYIAFQLINPTSTGSYNIQSFIINGIEQLVAPNPFPLIYP